MAGKEDDIVNWLFQQMSKSTDGQSEMEENMEEWERTGEMLLVQCLKLTFEPYIASEGRENRLLRQGDAVWFVPVENESGLDSWRPIDDDRAESTAAFFKYYEGHQQIEDHEDMELQVSRERSGMLGPNQEYLLLTKRFDPGAPIIRGLLEKGNGEMGEKDRVIRIDLFPNPSAMKE